MTDGLRFARHTEHEALADFGLPLPKYEGGPIEIAETGDYVLWVYRGQGFLPARGDRYSGWLRRRSDGTEWNETAARLGDVKAALLDRLSVVSR